MMGSYREASKFLESYIPTPDKKHPGELGLRRMEYLVGLLGNPQMSFRSIHIAGTSGKGSTATIIASILATKYKTGLHTSPHLERVNERISLVESDKGKLTSNNISDRDFLALANSVKPAVKTMGKSKWGLPSFFEIITGMAFLYFKKEKIDYAVIETGMGGRYDATNVVKPEVAVLTNVGLDHTEVLGGSVEEIAKDKAGIIKPGIKVVAGVKQPPVKKIIRIASSDKDAKSSFLGEDFRYKIKIITDKGSYFDYSGKENFRNLHISLLGAHQVENAGLAIRAIEEAGGFDEKRIRIGLEGANIAGRMEIVKKKPLVILDGAHNPDKTRALEFAMKTIWPGKKVILILAIKEGKNADLMVEEILPITKKIYLTCFELLIDQGEIRSIETNKLKRIIRRYGFRGKINMIKNAKEAVFSALKSTKKEDIILIAGSLYLIGSVRDQFK